MAIENIPLGPRKSQTPCQGMCSTIYGDAVCRGCKRYAHEVTLWNRMPTRDQERVWHRLRRLYRESINALVVVNDLTKLRTSAESVIDDGDFEPYRCIYLVLKRVFDPLSELGLSKRGSQETLSARDLFVQIERDLYERACLAYEHAYKVRIPQGKLESTSDDTGLAPLSQRQRNP